MSSHYDLPTVEQAQEFLRLINVGREAAGLEPLEKVPFDDAMPGAPRACLSASSLFAEIGFTVGAAHVYRVKSEDPASALEAMGMSRSPIYEDLVREQWAIPEAIKRVTDPFDMEESGLRDRLVEAGIV